MKKYITFILFLFVVIQGTAYDFSKVRKLEKTIDIIYKVDTSGKIVKSEGKWVVDKYIYGIRMDVFGFDWYEWYTNKEKREKDFDRICFELKTEGGGKKRKGLSV